MKQHIFVFADWKGMDGPKLIGTLSAQVGKGKKAFSFEYNKDWLNSPEQILLDPDIKFFSGHQFPYDKENFGIFLDSMPDTWGRTLMKRRLAQIAKEKGENPPKMYDIDYLLGVYDETRMGGIRFKTELNGPFLDDNLNFPTPPWASIRELQSAAKNYEEDIDNQSIKDWLNILIAPGSSLGGARPKANIIDENGELWIAKFPSKNDEIDKAAWEFLAYQLAIMSGIKMSECRIEKVMGKHHTFFTKRFDRERNNRIHFSSAMTMTNFTEEKLRFETASYLHIVDFIQNFGINVNENLEQLWRRIVFNILISNTDDHLRNHGFLLENKGWTLSPAYDLNPSIDRNGLSLNIDLENNGLDLEIVKSVGEYFRLTPNKMEKIISEIRNSVSQWQDIANKIGIPRSEQEMMKSAFVENDSII